jgi:PAS domain S-box-containing protein
MEAMENMNREDKVNIPKGDMAHKLAVRLAVTLTLIIGLMGSIYYFISVNQATNDLQRQSTRQAEELANVLSTPVWNLDRNSIEQTALAYMNAGNVVGLLVLDEKGNALYQKLTDEQKPIIETRQIEYNGQIVGSVQISVSTHEIDVLRNNIFFLVLAITVVAVLTIFLSTWFLLQLYITLPLAILTQGIEEFAKSGYSLRLEPLEQNELNIISEQFNAVADQIQARDQLLEQRVADRTRDLDIASKLSRQITKILDMDDLLHLMVDQTRESFNLYNASVYLYQPETRELILAATDTEESQVQEAVRVIGIDAQPSLVAQAARMQKQVVINDVTQSTDYLVDNSLPDARSEAVFPMVIGAHLVGVLDLISEKTDRFSDADVQILNTLAEQVGIAVRNAQLYAVQVQAADELRHAHEKLELYRFWFESSPDPIITYDTQGYVTSANSAFESIFGWTLDEIIGKRLNFVPEESRHTVKPLIEALYRDGKVIAADDGKRSTKDGRILDVQLSAALIKNNAGEVSGNVSIFRDVTRQKQMERKIADRTRDLDIASKLSRQITQVLDMDELLHLMVDQTKEGFNLYGASVYLYQPETRKLTLEATTDEEERQMKKAVRIISIDAHPSLIAYTARERKRFVINDVSQSAEYLVDPSLPDTRSEAVFPMMVGTHLIGVLDLVAERTDRFGDSDVQILTTLAEQIGIAVRNVQLYSVQVQAAAELRRADEMKTQFHSSVSHELRTPLNAIINYVEMVAGGVVGPISEEQKELLSLSLQSSNHLLSLINDILDISKIQAGKLTLFVEDDVDLYEILDSVIGVAAGMFKHRPVKFEMDIDRGLPILSCDRRRIRQILLNLLSNASKFTEEGAVTLGARNCGDHILFSIKDTGAGIPSELLSIIFEPYVQTLDGVKKEQGTGLGLPISRSFAQAHGGNLWVESTVCQGSTFFFSLPLVEKDASKQDSWSTNQPAQTTG